ncbi:hypothetical protein [Gordonia rubripertincta]|uniref:hypothetical protein n=1 Tax=Gordonia rubripertincta TaxID=36822 RepID=UPI0015FAEB8D|nr:hypothetical protein [Gordonia rubripertincta]QMU22508.1 hypothetical protein H3V45_08590 [Gordonia rubripertincta]
MSYRVIAPLIVAPDDDGQLHYHYEGAEVESIADDAAKRLVADGLIEKKTAKATGRSTASKSTTKSPAKKSTETEAAKGDSGSGGLPPFTAPDEDWIAYAIEQGMEADDAKTMPRQELIAKFAQQ